MTVIFICSLLVATYIFSKAHINITLYFLPQFMVSLNEIIIFNEGLMTFNMQQHKIWLPLSACMKSQILCYVSKCHSFVLLIKAVLSYDCMY